MFDDFICDYAVRAFIHALIHSFVTSAALHFRSRSVLKGGMGHNLKWDTLSDYSSRQANIYARCYHCNRTSVLDAASLERYFAARGWSTGIGMVYSKLVCSRCSKKVGKVGPSRELATVQVPRFRQNLKSDIV